MPPDSADDVTRSPRWWLRGLGAVWLAVFLAWFYSFALPNGRLADGTPLSRMDVWSGLIDVLLENVFPTPSPQAPPSGWEFLHQRFDLMAVAALILCGAWGLGHLMLRLLRLHDQFDTPSRIVFAFGLGMSGLSLLTLGCGLAGLLSRALLGGAIVLLAALETICRFRTRRPRGAQARTPWSGRRWDLLPIVCILAVAPFVLAMLLGALLPSIDFDVKEYHLEGPKEFFLLGRVTFLPHNVYTSFPFLTEILSLLAMVLRDDWYRGALAGKAVLMSLAPLTAVGLFAAGRRWFNSTVGWLAVLLYLSTPWVYRISVIAYAEGGLTFFLFATLLALLWLTTEDTALSTEYPVLGAGYRIPRAEDRVPGSRSRGDQRQPPLEDVTGHGVRNAAGRRIFLGGLLAGSAMACKYPGILSVAIPLGTFLLIAAWRRTPGGKREVSLRGSDRSATSSRLRQVAVAAGLFTLGALATFGPWIVKNITETGNPVYPLLYSVFGGRDWDEAAHRKWQAAHPPAIVGLAGNPDAIPANLGQRLVDVVARSDWQSPLLFGAAPLALLWSCRRRLAIWLWAYVGWLFVTWWALTHQIDRFWVPLLPVVTLLAAIGLGALFGAERENDEHRASVHSRQLALAIRAGVALLVAAAVVFNLGLITTRLSGYNAYLVDLDAARRDAMTPSIALLQERLPPDARVLLVGEAQVFDARFEYRYNTVFDESLLERWTAAALPGVPAGAQPLRPADDIRRTLREQGITHVFVNWSEILRYRTTYGYTDSVSPERFRRLVAAEILTPVALDPQRSLRAWDSLDASAREEVAEWGKSLQLDFGGFSALQQYELFEVR